MFLFCFGEAAILYSARACCWGTEGTLVFTGRLTPLVGAPVRLFDTANRVALTMAGANVPRVFGEFLG